MLSKLRIPLTSSSLLDVTCIYSSANMKNCSFNHNVQELVPVGWFKPTETHGQSLDLLHDLVINLVFVFLRVLRRTQRYLQKALFY